MSADYLDPGLHGRLEQIARRRLQWVQGPQGHEALARYLDFSGPPAHPPADSRPGARPATPGFVTALMQARQSWQKARDGQTPAASCERVPVIAKVKRQSPSAGVIRTGVDALRQARLYEAAGACAVSVLAEGEFFGGSLEDVRAVACGVGVPVLFKDVVVHPLQLELARAVGARAVLLIASVLRERHLVEFAQKARGLGLEVLVEVHRREELGRALAAEPDAVGINNRDLTTFRVDLGRVAELLPELPPEIPVVAESGYLHPQDVVQALELGAAAVLVGEALMRAEDPAAFLRQVARPRRELAECG